MTAKHICILVPDGQVNMGTLATIVGVVELFAAANSYQERRGRRLQHLVQTAGVSKRTGFSNGRISLRPDVALADVGRSDLVIVPPSAIRDPATLSKGNRLLVKWITQQHRAGAEIAGMCSGLFMLAASGILDGKSCSAHWLHASAVRSAFPALRLHEERLITYEAGIYTNGGAYSFLNLALLLVEKYYDRPTAIYCSKVFQVEIDRRDQSAFAIFSGEKMHSDEMILKAQHYLEINYREKIGMDELARRFNAGRRNFDRRFVKATGRTPLDYLQRLKVEAAKQALETGRKHINEVMYDVGYADARAFREVFTRITGLSPAAYRARYNAGYAVLT